MDTSAQTRFSPIARLYDLASGEWPIYRTGRRLGIAGLQLRPGDTVLDVGCGTGLNLPLLQDAVGPGGSIIGLDVDMAMLREASRRLRANEWSNVALVHADATTVAPRQLLRQAAGLGFGRDVDAVLCTYALSLMTYWRAAWRTAVAVARSDARVCVVDMARPTGLAAAWTPVTELIAAAAGSDLSAQPWTAVEQEATNVDGWSAWGGHIQGRTGTLQKR